MAKRYMYWCPDGCGKKVCWTGERYNRVEMNFICTHCHKRFNSETIKNQ